MAIWGDERVLHSFVLDNSLLGSSDKGRLSKRDSNIGREWLLEFLDLEVVDGHHMAHKERGPYMMV